MSNFEIHTIETAPDDSKPLLEKSQKTNGYIPNLDGVLATSPELLKTYQYIHENFVNSSFDNDELTVVWQTINVYHECHYCVPAHTAIARSMKVDSAITEALRNGDTLPTEKLQALHKMTLAIVENRGNVSEEGVQEFFDAGYTQKHILEIILGVSQKTISNYTNHFAETPLDQGFAKYEWKKQGATEPSIA